MASPKEGLADACRSLADLYMAGTKSSDEVREALKWIKYPLWAAHLVNDGVPNAHIALFYSELNQAEAGLNANASQVFVGMNLHEAAKALMI